MQSPSAMSTAPLSATFALCLHCGERLSPAQERFCCGGCEFVHSLLNSKGLERYYDLRENKPRRVEDGGEEMFAYCDDPQFIGSLSGDGRTLDFFLEGVDCTACVWLLEKLPDICPEAESARLKIGAARLRVTRKPGASFAAIARALAALGHRPRPIPTETVATRAQAAADRQDLVRLGVAAFATGNIMLLSVSLYAGADGVWAERFRWVMALLALPALTYSAAPFYRSAWAALKNGRLNIDIPIMLAVVVGIAVSALGLATGAETLYFDSLTMLVLLLLASRIWLKRLRRNYMDAGDIDRQLLAGTVQRFGDSGARAPVSALSVRAGDLIEVPRGQLVPVDGVATDEGFVQNAALTGESVAERRIAGDRIEAGARALSAALRIRATADFGASRLSTILKEAERDAAAKPRWIRFSDKVAQVFVIAVTAVAALTFAAFAATDPGEGARRALALIIVTCPCVFGMAIPLSISLATRAAAGLGVIVKNADLFERLGSVRHAIFDKTGTLTVGDMRVTRARAADGSETDPEAVEALLALEQSQPHPIARAVRERFQTDGAPPSPAPSATSTAALERRALPGGGLAGRIAGRDWRVEPFDAGADAGDGAELQSGVRVFSDDRLRLEVVADDRLKPGARAAIRRLRDRGARIHLFSGDHPTTVETCAKQLGLDPRGGDVAARLTPEQKAARVRALGDGTLMIGDGANDAPALAAATAGIAVHGAMDVSLKVADAYVMGASLEALPELFTIADRARRAIRRNLAFSATFNLIAGGLAVGGAMTPLWAAVLMPLSSLAVLASALSAGARGPRAAPNARPAALGDARGPA